MGRLTYKSSMGDYGSAVDWKDQWQEIYALGNKVGKYEDNDWKVIEKDGNPKESGYYLVTRILFDDSKTVGRRFYNSKTKRWSEDSAMGARLIAWKYLPKPYEEGEEESFETYEE